MSAANAEAIRVAGTVEMMSAAGFQDELRRAARYCPRLPTGDPLAAALKKIELNPAFTQSRLLTRILTALTYQKGEFRRAEAAALDLDTLSIVITLMDACSAGTLARAEWIHAVDAANAAQLGAGG
jgi:hypothetical protein